jgi:hypothetical protein
METEPLSEISVFRMLNFSQIMAKAWLQCHNCGGGGGGDADFSSSTTTTTTKNNNNNNRPL